MDNPGLMTRLMEWVRHPYSSDMSATKWVLFLGLILIAVFMWSRVMVHVTNGVESIT